MRLTGDSKETKGEEMEDPQRKQVAASVSASFFLFHHLVLTRAGPE